MHIKNEAGKNSSINRVPLIQSYNNQSDLGVCLGGKRSKVKCFQLFNQIRKKKGILLQHFFFFDSFSYGD